jgi:hypothetical protein
MKPNSASLFAICAQISENDWKLYEIKTQKSSELCEWFSPLQKLEYLITVYKQGWVEKLLGKR